MAMDETEQRLHDINAQFDQMRATLEALGADLSKVILLEEQRQQQIQQVIQSQLDARRADAEQEYAEARSAYLSALQEEQSALNSTISEMESVIESIRSAKAKIWTSELSAADPRTQYESLREAYLEAYARASGGDADAASELSSLGNQLLQASMQVYGDVTDYMRDLNLVNSTLSDVSDLAKDELDIARDQLSTIQRQLEVVEGIQSGVQSIEALMQQYFATRDQLASLGGSSRYGVEAASNAISADKINLAVNYWYQSELGRAPDPAGLAYWSSQVASGAVALKDLKETIRYVAWKAGELPGAAEGGILSGPSSGFPAILHGTELVVPLDASGKPGKPSTLDSLKEELRALRAEIRSVALHTHATAKTLRQWDFDGQPPAREVS
jgi:hypothetical protein